MTAKPAVLFDFDGTLVDSHRGLVRCLQAAFVEFDVIVTDEQVKADIGAPFMALFRSYGMAETDAEACIEVYRERYRSGGMFEADVYEGVPQLLVDLVDDGYMLATASSKPAVFVRALLEHFDLDGHFAHIVGAELDGSVSAKADVVALALDRLRARPEEAVMVGDRHHDVTGARACGVERTIGALWGFGTAAELREAGAWQLADAPADVARHIGGFQRPSQLRCRSV
jgi:phosphoglycolate phosphatase